jgi:hypothetical protein
LRRIGQAAYREMKRLTRHFRGTIVRYVTLALMFMVLAGCALVDIGQASSREWSRDGATEQDLARERRVCEQQAARSTPAGDPTISSASAESRRFIACMQARGWR